MLNLSTEDILQRLDRSSADALVRSLADELARLHRQQAVLTARLAAMESLQTMADRILDAGEGGEVRYAERARIDAAHSFLDTVGFHALEQDENGMPYRWSGPERTFAISIFVDRRRPMAFALCFGRLYSDAPLELLRAFVDGEDAGLSIARLPNRYEARGLLPPREEPGATVLTFVVPEMQSPADGGLADERQLGLSFECLCVDPLPAAKAPQVAAPVLVAASSDAA